METVLEYIARGYVPLIANIGLLALVAWVVSLFGQFIFTDTATPGLAGASIIGLTFGLAASLLMGLPIEMEPGIFGDARGAPVLLSGIVGGPVAAVVTGTIAASTRLIIGGPGALTGAIFVGVFALSGLVWHYFCHRRRRSATVISELMLLATITTGITSPLVLLFPPEKQFPVLISLWPQLWVANVAGVTILGTLIRREYQRQITRGLLVKARARAEREAKARTRFLNAMSHEMRTPLNGIIGILQLVQNRPLPSDIRHDLKIAADSGSFLLSLINQVLDLAKMEAGKTDITPKPFTTDALVDNLYSMFKYQADSKEIGLTSNLSGETSKVLSGDFDHIRQLVFNLLGNAIKFTAEGGVDIHADVTPHLGRWKLQIRISDTGPGIPADQLDRIFEEFEQTSVGKAAEASSGLGLSICRHLSDMMGGQLSVESVEGRGSVFSFSIILDASSDSIARGDSDEDAPVVAPLRILVAEDNAINQMVVKGLLEQDGHSVTIADNGQIVLDLVHQQNGQFDAILMDIQMPVMDGIEATRILREADNPAAKLPIIALTANAFTNQQEEFITAGMDDVLTKPLIVGELRRKLSSLECARVIERTVSGEAVPATTVGGHDNPPDQPSDSIGRTNIESRFNEFRECLEQQVIIDMLTSYEEKANELYGQLESMDSGREGMRELLHQLSGMTANLGFAKAAEAARAIGQDEPDQAELRRRIETARDVTEQSMDFVRTTILPGLGQDLPRISAGGGTQ